MKTDSLLPVDMDSRPASAGAFVWLCLLFAAGLLVMLPNVHAYFFGNEHYYTDSAIRMRETGHYLAPVYSDGTLRFNKPILSYWMILAGFRVLGISVLGSRVASLLAGVGVLLLTGLFVRRLFGSRDVAFVAMAILASNIEFITASMRATPDIFLCLSVLLSLYGFAGLLLESIPRARDAWCAYIGVGLAVADKGMLGVALLGYVACFALAFPDRRARVRALLWPAPLLAGLAVALGWFVAVAIRYGGFAIQGFVHDQVGSRISHSGTAMAWNLLHYSLGLAFYFFPWSALLAVASIFNRSAMKDGLAARPRVFLFLLGWYAILLVVFAPANLSRMRYLLPGFPLVAAGTAALLVPALSHPAVERLARHLLRIFAVASIPGIVLLIGMTGVLDAPRLGLAAAVLTLLGTLLVAGARRARRERLPALFAAAAFVSIWGFHFLVRPVFPSTPAYELVRTLREDGVQEVVFPLRTTNVSRESSSLYKDKYAGQIRLISGGRIDVKRRDLARCLAPSRSAVPIICAGDDVLLFPSNRFIAVRSGSMLRGGAGPADIRSLFTATDKPGAFKALFVPYYVLFPTDRNVPNPSGKMMAIVSLSDKEKR